MKKTICTFLTLALIGLGQVYAQIQTPAPSPRATLQQTVGLTSIEVDYSRPGMKERKIFGDLIQNGELWRFGANAATKITFSDDVNIQGNTVPAGAYSMFAITADDSWTIILNKDATVYVGNYKQEDDQLRFKVNPIKLKDSYEQFTLDFTEIRENYGILSMSWENTRVNIKIDVNYDDKVMAAISKAMEGTSARDYYVAAVYYSENDKDINQALEWMNIAIEKYGDPKYWVLRQKSLIQAKAGDTKGAIETAKKSMELAEKAENRAYVDMNKASIAEWTKKK